MTSMNLSEDRSSRGFKRTGLLDTAARALNRNGVSRTSLVEIAKSVGISRAALYYYFESQEDLVFKCYLRSCEFLASSLGIATNCGLDAMGAIETFIDNLLAENTPELAALSDVAYLLPEQQSIVLARFTSIRDELGVLLEEGARKGQLRPCAGRVVAASIIGLISWLPMAERWPSAGPSSKREMVEAIKAMLRHGVASQRDAPASYRPFQLSPMTLPAYQIFDSDAVAAARREALMAAASWLFNLKGVDATSQEEIALRVGVTKKVIYHNLGDKDMLVAECYRRSFRFFEDIAVRARTYEGPRIDAICAGAHALAEASLRSDIAPLVPLAGFHALPDRAKEAVQASNARMFDIYIDLYLRGQAEGSIRDDFAPRTLLSVRTGTYQWLPKWFDTLSASELAAAPGEVAELLRLGLSPLGVA
jgi:AcrR family transcriptional regulator